MNLNQIEHSIFLQKAWIINIDAEIPTIIARIFENQNLEDVLVSPKMAEAKQLLESQGIQCAFTELPKESEYMNKKKEDTNYHLFPNINELKQEKQTYTELLEQKKDVKNSINFKTVMIVIIHWFKFN